MTLAIPTAEFVGLLGDVIPFAFPKPDNPVLNMIHLEWDGEHLHAQAIDGLRIAWSTWDPDVIHDDDPPAENDLFTTWGSASDPWEAHVPREVAVELVRVYKLPAKLGWTPLHIDRSLERLIVERRPETGMSAHVMDVPTPADIEFPDVRSLLADAEKAAAPTDAVQFWAHLLADFAKVRPRGPLRFDFAGDAGTALVRIGSEFRGAVHPARIEPLPGAPESAALEPEPAVEVPGQTELVGA